MRNVSEEYKQAVTGQEIYTRLEGELTAGSRTYDITDAIIMPGSLSINRKAINRSSFEYGAVITSEANITLILPDADRYTMYNAALSLTLYTRLSDGTEEALKLGEWIAAECTKTKKYLAIKAYDNMLRFDQTIEADTVGDFFDILIFICDKCGVEFGMTREEIEALPNGKTQARVRAEEIDTYRDLISYIAMITCTFAKIDENGRLILQPFGKEPAGTIIKRQVQASSISDFQSLYSGVEARFIADTNYAPYEVIESSGGLILDMGDIPIVRGLPETKYETLQNILNDLKQIVYTPVELSIIGDPSIEPGDMLTIQNANLTEDDVTTLVTSTTWNFHKEMKIVSAGSNPKLANAKDKSSKQLASMENTVAGKDVIILSYTNAEEYEIRQEYIEIVDLNYITNAGCKPIFLMTVSFVIDTDGIVEFTLYNGLVEIPHASYQGYYLAGEHFATIFYFDSVETEERKNIRVLARAYQQEGSLLRQQAADIQTLKNAIEAVKTSDLSRLAYVEALPDATDPVLTIKAQKIKAALYAQGISTSSNGWDGNLKFTDHIGLLPLLSTNTIMFNDTVQKWLDTPKTSTINETFGLIPLEGCTVAFQDRIGVNEVVESYIVDTTKELLYDYNRAYVAADEAYRLRTVYEKQEAEYVNNIARIKIDNTVYKKVEEVTVS